MRTSSFSKWMVQLRTHQWVKNFLLFVPALASFQFLELTIIKSLALAFASFCLASSAVYIFNDIFDRESDRAHEFKRNRPIASGQISLSRGLIVAIIFLASGLITGYFVGNNFFFSLLAYIGLTFAYSLWLKRLVLVDAIVLAALYTLRVIAGGVASGISISFWLLAFSAFFFTSLAWVKRYAELESSLKKGQDFAPGRGYKVSDLPVILAFGASSAFSSVLIFALYLDSATIRLTYSVPEVAWLAIPLVMYLIARMWLKAHRGEMNQDPIWFVLRDAPSLSTLFLLALALLEAHIGFGL